MPACYTPFSEAPTGLTLEPVARNRRANPRTGPGPARCHGRDALLNVGSEMPAGQGRLPDGDCHATTCTGHRIIGSPSTRGRAPPRRAHCCNGSPPGRFRSGTRSASDEAANTLPLRVFAASPVRAPGLVRPECGAQFVDHVGVAEEVVHKVLRPGAEVQAPVGGRDRPPGVQQDRSPPGNRDVPLARHGLGR